MNSTVLLSIVISIHLQLSPFPPLSDFIAIARSVIPPHPRKPPGLNIPKLAEHNLPGSEMGLPRSLIPDLRITSFLAFDLG